MSGRSPLLHLGSGLLREWASCLGKPSRGHWRLPQSDGCAAAEGARLPQCCHRRRRTCHSRPAPAPNATAVAATAAVAARKTAPVVTVARAVVAAAATWPLPLASRATRLAAGTAKRSSDAAKRAWQAVASRWVGSARYERASSAGGQVWPFPFRVPCSDRPSAPPADPRAPLLPALHSAHQHAPVQSTYHLWYFCAAF